MPATLLIGLAGIVLDDQVTPRSEQALTAWWNRTDPTPENGRSFWFHEGSSLIHIGHVADGGNMLGTVDVYMRDANSILSKILHAQTAQYTGAHGWTLYDIEGLTIDLKDQKVDRQDHLTDMPWHTTLAPRDFIRLSSGNPPLSTTTIIGMLRAQLPSDASPGVLKAGLIERFLRPASLLVLLLIAMPVIYIPPRPGTRSWFPVWCLAAGLRFMQISAGFSGVADLKKAFDAARKLAQGGIGTLLFVDEIHRFNRAQQDGFLPVVEDGTVVLVGATTENPSFALNSALL